MYAYTLLLAYLNDTMEERSEGLDNCSVLPSAKYRHNFLKTWLYFKKRYSVVCSFSFVVILFSQIYMLFAGRIGKILYCTGGLEYAAECHYRDRGHSLFPNTDRPRPANIVFIFSTALL